MMALERLRAFFRRKSLPHSRRLAEAQGARLAALEAVREAETRGDTRAAHDARQRALQATHDLMAKELGIKS